MNQVSKIRILIVDDHAIVRMGLAAILGTKADLEVVGDAEDGTAAIQKAQKLRPDVVLMDIVMPEMDGATATAKILRLLPQTKVIILTSFGEADGIAHALDAGASGALMKNVDYSELVTAIRAVMEGETVVAPEIRKMIKDMPPVPELSERQRDILISISRGLTDADIATQLNLSPYSVREHITTIFKKLDAANKAEAVAIATRKQLLNT
ncbi:MAG: response regulator transcription factor [Lentisphaerae bacterium]|nr:response regulator transcription factor [Lentisphaerota bacterium]